MKSHNWEWRREVGSSRHREEESSTGMERGLKRKEGDLDGRSGGKEEKKEVDLSSFKEEYFRSTVEQMLEDGLHSDITFEWKMTELRPTGILEHASLYDMSLLERCKEFIGSNLKKIVGIQVEELAVRNPTLIVDLVRSTALDEKSRELRISFRSFSTTKVRNSTLRMPRECSVADLISELKQLMKLPSTRWLGRRGVVSHRIVNAFSHFKSGMEFANFHFAKRSNLHPDAPFPEYLGDGKVPVHRAAATIELSAQITCTVCPFVLLFSGFRCNDECLLYMRWKEQSPMRNSYLHGLLQLIYRNKL
ncbi:hypothetical protein R1flu_017269 [Riccia fluitans]|uniref:Uncharacterized protein n=1 Tax=Riccia fluitans TaxID=41844 RepID=A0ABD1XDP8_9MARC